MEDMIQSDAAFREQFDRQSNTFHGGSTVPVPVGGQRVPDALSQEADWRSLPVQEPEEKKSFGPEYDRVEKLRNDLGDLKKTMSNINAPVEAIMKLSAQLSSAQPEETEKLTKNLESEKQKRQKVVEELDHFNVLLKGSEYGQLFLDNSVYSSSPDKYEHIEEIKKAAAKAESLTKEEQIDFGSLVKRHTTQIFREQKVLLEKMKALKKQQQ
ncbi:hypothetical protein PROFUN_00255 [Planoprotostelium fungivorum]|uniref:Uncharacterized protein n=1 Tax=Planoprotostelium fungivorum TaxID=1890364 RepID=A0A2P6NXV7_9EUKA|nr:hypothetical protein PROFUN_00255 [Planoprotostelium fungivorum]